jgi:hypothetical protein
LALELVRVDAGDARARSQQDASNGETLAGLVDLDRGLGLDALRAVSRLTEPR